jgi:hypothetical protein
LSRELATEARARRFVTASVSLAEHRLDSPDDLVRSIIDALTPPGESRARGLLWLLERFYDEHGEGSSPAFDKVASSAGATEELSALCSWYLSSNDPEPPVQLRAYRDWLDGKEPPKRYRHPGVRRPLSEQTAQRVLGELTRVMLALGYRGTVILLSQAGDIAERTDRQREKAYTVMRELVDNFDSGRGAMATRIVLTGDDALFVGARSIRSIEPLHMRLQSPSGAEPPPPHRSSVSVATRIDPRKHRKVSGWERQPGHLESLIRISEGLPPVSGVTKMSVGQERLDRTIARLFEIVKRSGSFFSSLVGDYGSGKTHLMMHLAERAYEDQRPVFWLNLERTNLDLGNPARHLRRLLDHSQMPMRGRPSALDLLSRWTRSERSSAELIAILEELAAGGDQASRASTEGTIKAAQKALRVIKGSRDPAAQLEVFLSGTDLADRPGDSSYRLDAYRRLFLWLELLARKENIRGPVVLIDEAENLYTSGRSPASRRTSLRSLGFYCGGALPGTCVILAMTPPAFEELKGEARDLLEDAAAMETTLDIENVDRFRRSLWGLKPEPVKALKKVERIDLCQRVRRMHRSVRGAVDEPEWDQFVRAAVDAHDSPRTLIRAVVDRLESTWWRG